MEHPFTAKLELTEHQINAVYGGNLNHIQPATTLRKLKSVIKPAMATTMAIGEEGGFFHYV